jgi:hypothetical protein
LINSHGGVSVFLTNFEIFAKWNGEKYYLTLETENPKGTLTILKSKDGRFFYHRKNERYWDIKEIPIETGILMDVIWAYRAAINESIKGIVVS